MPTIENTGSLDPAQFQDMDDNHLILQDFVQQGAVNAISTLLKRGCTEANAHAMLESLQKFAAEIRKVGMSRGIVHFDRDQLADN